MILLGILGIVGKTQNHKEITFSTHNLSNLVLFSMSSVKSLGWGKVEVAKPVKLQEIMSDQESFPDFNFTRQTEDEDFEFALMIQDEEMANAGIGAAISEDQILAECIQRIEDEEASSHQRRVVSMGDVGEFSKITVGSSQSVDKAKRQSDVVSSEFLDALQLEHSLQHSSRDVQCMFKHDKLLQGLSNSASLSELDGVGDLLGSKLLVNNTVANSLRTFVHKNEDRQSQMKLKKWRKANPVVPNLPIELKPQASTVSDDIVVH